jgi:hypothetical protein
LFIYDSNHLNPYPSTLVFFVFVLYLVYPTLSVSLGYSFLIALSVFSNVYLSCVLCTQCCQCLWGIHSRLHFRFSLTFICPVSLDCSVLFAPSVFSNIYLFCVLILRCSNYILIENVVIRKIFHVHFMRFKLL